MSTHSAQVSAIISAATKEKLDRFTDDAFDRLAERIEGSAVPTASLRELMRGRNG